MLVRSINRANGNNISQESLLFYLSQVVLVKTDEEIKSAQLRLKAAKARAGTYKTEIAGLKSQLEFLTKDYSREKALKRVLALVNTLKQEGVLIGRNRVIIKNLLLEIDNKNFQQLRNYEEQLSLKIPDKY